MAEPVDEQTTRHIKINFQECRLSPPQCSLVEHANSVRLSDQAVEIAAIADLELGEGSASIPLRQGRDRRC